MYNVIQFRYDKKVPMHFIQNLHRDFSLITSYLILRQ